jgi:hypothetical protein
LKKLNKYIIITKESFDMKIAEISELEQKQIDEAPAGMLKQLGRNIGAAAAGAIGMKNTAANLKGKAEVGKTANDVFTKFNKYLGTQQKSVKTATGDDLANFLQNTYNYNQAQIPQGTLNKKQIYDIINKMASDGYAQMGKGGGAGGQSAGGGTAQATQGGASGGQASGGQQGAGGTAQGTAQGGATGQQGAAQGGGKSPAGKKATGGTAAKPAAQAGAKQAASGATEIPPNVQKMLDTLSATEKQALVGMLK